MSAILLPWLRCSTKRRYSCVTGRPFGSEVSKLVSTWVRWTVQQEQQQPQQGPAPDLAAEAACQPGTLTRAALAMSLSCADSGPWAVPWPYRCCSSLAAAHTAEWEQCLASALSCLPPGTTGCLADCLPHIMGTVGLLQDICNGRHMYKASDTWQRGTAEKGCQQSCAQAAAVLPLGEGSTTEEIRL